MSTEDIRIKLQADESGAVNAFRKLRSEVLNNEQGLKQLGQQGKMTGKGLKDMASFLGPEFQILGDRLDHVSGAMADIKGAGLLAKGAMIGLVATAGFQVGKMIGDWVFETEKWKEALAEARKEADRLNAMLLEGARNRASELSADELDRELKGTIENVSTLSMRLAELKQLQDKTWYVDRALGTDGFSERIEEIKTIEQELDVMRKLRQSYEEATQARQKQAEQAREAEEAKALAEEARAAEQAAAAAQRLVETQEDYLFTLEAELVKIKEGEDAYMRLTLAKRGFTEESINSALALKAEISELTEAAKARERSGTSGSGGGMSVTAPGQVQGTQARFITRGTGSSVQDKILEATRKQIEQQRAMLEEQKKTARILEKVARDPM
jgi:DNA repair exonuclease SbcCD ATPase subunit